MLVANSHKHFGMANVSSIVSKRKRTSISSFKGRKRSYNSAVRQAKKVLDNRKRPDGSQEYLIKWAKSTEKTWISRDLCSGDIKDLIDEYIREHAKLQIQPAEECIVDRIVMAGMWKGKKHYLVKWEGYGSEEDTWEAEDSLRADVPNIVEEFERNCKDSPVELE
jgi:pyruvate carboxylase